MPTNRPSISTAEASRRLGVTRATVVNMVKDGRLSGESGTQPERPRWRVHVDNTGLLVDKSGRALPHQKLSRHAEIEADVLELRHRVEQLERRLLLAAATRDDHDRYQEAALLLSGTLERQREALELQLRANLQLNEALTEQGRIIATLLVPEPSQLVDDSEN